MKTRTVEIKKDDAYLMVLGDLHIGDKAFGAKSRKLLEDNIKWVADNENCMVILNGDLLNTATRSSKTSPFEQDMTLEEQIAEAAKLLSPIKDRIIGAVMGNHERRVMDFAGFDPTIAILTMLHLDLEEVYFKFCGIIKLKIGTRMSRGSEVNKVAYTIAFHHTTGGGKLIGSKLNRVDQMTHSTVANADLYLGSHNHSLSTANKIVNEFNPYSETVEQRKQTLVSCGGYLEWNDSYAEAMQLEPVSMGSPKIHFSGTKKDIIVVI